MHRLMSVGLPGGGGSYRQNSKPQDWCLGEVGDMGGCSKGEVTVGHDAEVTQGVGRGSAIVNDNDTDLSSSKI